jgi:hypothetical protein
MIGFPAMNRAERRSKSRVKLDPLAIMWFSNAPWAGTGYGTQTAQAIRHFMADGHKVAVSANYGLQAMQTIWEDIPIYPMGYEPYSNDVQSSNFKNWQRLNPDRKSLFITLFDAWVLKGNFWDQQETAIWTMVDHVPVPPAVISFLKKPTVTPIAVTQFGLEQIQRLDIESLYVPMAIDTEMYKPTEFFDNGTERLAGWQLMGWDEAHKDRFTISLINANKGVVPSRKAWGENLLACSIFLKDHPDAQVYLHTERYGNMGGINLDTLVKAVGINEDQIRFVNQYAFHTTIPNEAMASIYTASDVLLASTMGEGFGLTVLEAESCGTRVIANNFSAQPELIADGWLTEGQPWWDPQQLAWFNTPSVPSIVSCLEEAYAKGKSRSDSARAHAAQYDSALVYEQYWRPALKVLSA